MSARLWHAARQVTSIPTRLSTHITVFGSLQGRRSAASSPPHSSQLNPAQQLPSTPSPHPLVPKEHLVASLPDDTQILRLKDGRLMSYAEYGSQAADAHPFIFCHGIPDCRLDACLLPSDQKLAEKLNIRWIGIDRPGIGLSSIHNGRNTLDWVADLRQLIDHLRLKRYYLFGVSGGTGYALAAAMRLPRDQVKGVGVMVGVAPWEAGTKGMSLLNRVGYALWKYYPGFFQWAFSREMVPLVQRESLEAAEEMARKQARWYSGEERAEMEKPEMIEGMARIWREVYRQGARGAVEDSKVQTSDWGFRIEDVDYPGVRLWYGEKDVNTPPAMGKYLAARLPGSVYKEYEGKSHFTMWHHIEEILADMLRDHREV